MLLLLQYCLHRRWLRFLWTHQMRSWEIPASSAWETGVKRPVCCVIKLYRECWEPSQVGKISIYDVVVCAVNDYLIYCKCRSDLIFLLPHWRADKWHWNVLNSKKIVVQRQRGAISGRINDRRAFKEIWRRRDLMTCSDSSVSKSSTTNHWRDSLPSNLLLYAPYRCGRFTLFGSELSPIQRLYL